MYILNISVILVSNRKLHAEPPPRPSDVVLPDKVPVTFTLATYTDQTLF